MQADVVAIIPARGGSKGIPQKNISMIAGKPLVAHSIEHALQCSVVTRTVVSTDDLQIASVAERYGAEVIWRPMEISGDTASTESALQHTLTHLRDICRFRPELVVLLQPTSPFRRADDITCAIQVLREQEADSLFSACPLHGFVWRREDGALHSQTYDYTRRPRRQDAPEDLIENGSIYVFKPWVLEVHDNRLGGKISVYPMDSMFSFQVDQPSDLVLIEKLMLATDLPATTPDLANIELLALDFDGVMTDNRVLVSENGTESVSCSRADGLGLAQLLAEGLQTVVISKERNRVVAARCQKLGVECIQACDDKLNTLRSLAADRGLTPGQIAYVGDDINDLPCFSWVGCAIAVANAVPEVRRAAHLLTASAGGNGAVREIVDRILAARRHRSASPERGTTGST